MLNDDGLESEGRNPKLLNFDTRWKWEASFTAQRVYPWGKSPQHPLGKRLGRLQCPSTEGERNPSLAVNGTTISRPSSAYPNSYTEQMWLLSFFLPSCWTNLNQIYIDSIVSCWVKLGSPQFVEKKRWGVAKFWKTILCNFQSFMLSHHHHHHHHQPSLSLDLP